ncbi:hypothetical protein RhiJN_25692 [Ceratobasidium sp. AG-Ba]|nr:hypothetical protein RhiJN_25692 [Ceratobasidium sp. AG-Ba]
MLLLVTYQPEGHEELVAEMMPSESCEEVINSACEMWEHHLPPKDRIIARHLERQPQRFTELVRNNAVEELELRLQIKCASVQSLNEIPRRGTRSPSTLELPLPATPTMCVYNNQGPHPSSDGNYGNFAGLPPIITTPLTPESVFDITTSREQRPFSPASPPASTPQPNAPSASSAAPPSFDKGVSAFLAGKHADSRVYFQQAANEFHERGDLRREADCLRHLGMSCRHLKDYVIARSHLLTARAIYESLGPECRQEQLRCSRHLARVDEESGNYSQALMTYQELLRTTEEEKLVIQHTWCLYYLAHLYNHMKKHKEARSLLKDVVNTSQQIRHGEIEAFATEEAGYTAEREGHPQLAMNCYEKALSLLKTHGEGKWIESENRVKKRMDLLSRSFPAIFRPFASRKWSIGAKLLNPTS